MKKMSGAFLFAHGVCAILAYFCLHLVAMAILFAPLKIQVAYFNSLTPKILHSC